MLNKKPNRKLVLRTHTLRTLTEESLRTVVGGFIMKDTVIIPRTGNPFGPARTARSRPWPTQMACESPPSQATAWPVM